MRKIQDELMQMVAGDRVDPSFIISHRLSLEDEPGADDTFKEKKDDCIKVVMHPHDMPMAT